MGDNKKNNILKKLQLCLIILMFLTLCFIEKGEAAVLTEKNNSLVEENKIIFTDGTKEYVYTLKELKLIRIKKEENYGLSRMRNDIVYCSDPSWLSYKLYILAQKVYCPAVDAHFYQDEDGKIQIEPEKEGKELDLGGLISKLGNPWSYQEVYFLPIKTISPQVCSENLKEKLPNNLWAQYTTKLVDIPNRTENVRLASKMLDGVIIGPGKSFSFNESVGPRIKERGYRPAKIVVAGKFQDGVGGGVCQVSSTLYNTLLLSGLEIKERYNHSLRIAYVGLGRDATVVYGCKDLKFYNQTPHYLILRTKLEGLRLTISIYGSDAFPFKEIMVRTKTLKVYQPTRKYVVNELLNEESKVIKRGRKGYLVETSRDFMQEEGKITEVVSRDYYAPTSTIVAIKAKNKKT